MMLLLCAPVPLATECSLCGEDLNEEEREEPRKEGDEYVCDECWDEHNTFPCFRCECSSDNDTMNYLAILEECGGLGPGIYRINRRPYFISNYFDMWWIKESLSRIRDADGEYSNPADYSSGFLCYGCQREMNLVEPVRA